MGNREKELESIVSAPDWVVPALDQLEAELPDLENLMAKLAGQTGLAGSAAESAEAVFAELKEMIHDVHENVVTLKSEIQDANVLRRAAAGGPLPSATVEPGTRVLIMAASGAVIPPLGFLAAAGGIQVYENFLRGQREVAADQKLEALQDSLAQKSLKLKMPRNMRVEFVPDPPAPPYKPYTPPPYNSGSNTGSDGGAYNGPAGSVGPFPSSGGEGSGAGAHSTTPSVDGDLGGGYVPGGGRSGGVNGGGLPFRPGGGMGGLIGGGAGAAALAVGARIGGSGMAGAGGGLGGFGAAGGGASANPGAGGLLGGAKGGVGAAGDAAGGSGAAGARQGGGMMGGGQGGAGSEKEKRSGLGGPMAPKLEDDEELGPRSAGAMAGGRDTPASDEKPY